LDRTSPTTAPERLRAEAALRAEADVLVAGGLLDALRAYGAVHLVGSYRMELMAWRDLDIHLVPAVLDRRRFFELGLRIAELLRPRRMHYRDEADGPGDALPQGLYWGVYEPRVAPGAWKLDIWATDAGGLARVEAYCGGIERRLTAATRDTILMLKTEAWTHPEYRRGFGSADIYRAVLEHGIDSAAGFRRYLEERPK